MNIDNDSSALNFIRNRGRYDCPIWGESKEKDIPLSNTKRWYNRETKQHEVDSSRAGGTYRITNEAVKKLHADLSNIKNCGDNKTLIEICGDNKKLDDALYANNTGFKARLTTWLIQQRKVGNEHPLITVDVLEQVRQKNRLPIQERINNVLEYIYKKNQEHKDKFSHRPEYPISVNELKAYSECTDDDEWHIIFDYLEQNQLVKIHREHIDIEKKGLKIILDVKGLERLESLATNKDSRQVFVAMWFDESMDAIYDQAIKPAIEETGYHPMRIDRKDHNNKIDDEIIAEIKKSRFLIADFSHGQGGIRGGVYYEAGFAHGLGIPVIFTCRASDQDKLHFDTRQFNHIIWEEQKPEELKKALQNRIRATIPHPSKPQ